ncbi:glycosyltransferase 87 family protein [Kitasatospora cathayae]|uniref:Glycosyltransferase 87 family protein n=1 Tax=Kitasatospora cathayae TaxID=3004092 RepID=A0ABY7PWM6_9ACTN|nr:glycosyltransferase 87 family protein [Kitasatospora sp. HUAS 3-15]WBP84848.1 glycosyltransferase 87 family protein [Kitasatospora sp. HUAS 3-15]
MLTRTLPCAVALTALVTALALTVTGGGTLGDRPPLYDWYALDTALFALALLLLRRVGDRQVVPVVLAGSLLVAATGLLAPPRTSDDAYRYVWDGRVQAAGISPYAYAPDDPALFRLRDPGLFPDGDGCKAWDEHRTAAGDCIRINRPAVHTIYPPVAEAWFLVAHPFGGGVRGMQVGGALLAVATTGTLLLVGGRSRRAALWGWCPGVTVWAVNDAHVDALGALLMVAGLGCAARRRRGAGGALLGAAVATKLLPALALPGAVSALLARRPTRRDLVLFGSALGTFAAVYLPYVLASGLGVLGYLPGYLREEGYEQGHLERFGLLRVVLPDRWAPWAAALALAAVVLWVLRRGDPDRPWRGAFLVTGTALLLVAPSYPWYGLLLVALVALDGRWEWLAVPAAGQVLYLEGGEDAQRAAYGAALVCVLVVPLLRWAARAVLVRAASRSASRARPQMTKV